MEKKLKFNIHNLEKIISYTIPPEIFYKTIKNKKIGEVINYENEEYTITGATSDNGTFHLKGQPLRGRVFVKNRKRKLMVESELLDDKTNQVFLIKVE